MLWAASLNSLILTQDEMMKVVLTRFLITQSSSHTWRCWTINLLTGSSTWLTSTFWKLMMWETFISKPKLKQIQLNLRIFSCCSFKNLDVPHASIQNWWNGNLLKMYTGKEWILWEKNKVIGKNTLGITLSYGFCPMILESWDAHCWIAFIHSKTLHIDFDLCLCRNLLIWNVILTSLGFLVLGCIGYYGSVFNKTVSTIQYLKQLFIRFLPQFHQVFCWE